MTLDPAGLEAAAKALTKALDDVRGGYDHAENPTEACVRAYLAAAVPPTGENPRDNCPVNTPMGSCVPRCGAAMCEEAAGRAAATPDPPSDRNIARMFHEAYERLAPEFGYHTREESAVPWERVPARNRDLMTATVGEVRAHLAAASPDERLREALDNLLAAVTDVERCGEAGLIEALDDAMNDAADLLAAADRDSGDVAIERLGNAVIEANRRGPIPPVSDEPKETTT